MLPVTGAALWCIFECTNITDGISVNTTLVSGRANGRICRINRRTASQQSMCRCWPTVVGQRCQPGTADNLIAGSGKARGICQYVVAIGR